MQLVKNYVKYTLGKWDSQDTQKISQKGYSNLNNEFFKFRFELWESPSKDFLS